ncbi:hypothetical protein F4781DRAFT_378764 [Annulohypoxylon bovei var. microspora]|nr:hypothetical protein F4781DRAFT_378764 [Annulohypoxylon bovei var. microspora]
MDISSHLNNPSSPLLPPSLPNQHDSNTAIPPLTSELSSELSDLPNTTPIVSASEEENESENDDDPFLSHIVSDTEKFWEDKRQDRVRYGFKRFLENYLLTQNNYQFGSRVRYLREVLQNPLVRKRLSAAGIQLQFSKAKAKEWNADVPTFHHELSSLSPQPCFGRFDPEAFMAPGEGPCAVKDVCDTDWIENSLQEAWPQIQANCPGLAKFLSAALTNQRSGRKSYNTEASTHAPFPVAKAYMITALFLSCYAPRSNFLPLSIGMYLHSNGVQKRVITTLALFGVCASYQSIMGNLDQMAKQSRVRLNSQGSVINQGFNGECS